MDTRTDAIELINRANDLQNGGDKLAAAPLYLEAVEAEPEFASFALVAGDTYREAEMWGEARAAYQSVLDAHPGHPDAKAGQSQVEKAMKKASGRRGLFRRH